MKDMIIKRLERMHRKGITEFINYLEHSTFFQDAASTKYHGAYLGGLADHSINLYEFFRKMLHYFKLTEEVDDDSALIISIAHDLCKVGLYLGGAKPFRKNNNMSKEHAVASLNIVEKYIKLTDLERQCILYHMGMYATKEFSSSYIGQYQMKELSDAFNEKIVKLFYFCDDMVSQFVDE